MPVVQALQALSGILWLLPAVFLVPRVIGAWRGEITRCARLWLPLCFVSWLMIGFSIRWLTWPNSLEGMVGTELVTWASLYALSSVCAVWLFISAVQMKDD